MTSARTPTPLSDDEPDAPKVANRIKAAPKLGNVYWCAFPIDARKPEFWKTRPVVVVSYANTLLGPILVVPLTRKPQQVDLRLGNPYFEGGLEH